MAQLPQCGHTRGYEKPSQGNHAIPRHNTIHFFNRYTLQYCTVCKTIMCNTTNTSTVHPNNFEGRGGPKHLGRHIDHVEAVCNILFGYNMSNTLQYTSHHHQHPKHKLLALDPDMQNVKIFRVHIFHTTGNSTWKGDGATVIYSNVFLWPPSTKPPVTVIVAPSTFAVAWGSRCCTVHERS